MLVEERRPTKRYKKKENLKYPYKKMRKEKTKKIVLGIFLVFTLMFSLAGVFAQNQYSQSNKFSEEDFKGIQNKFQNKFQYNCTGECTYSEFGNNIKLQVREQFTISEQLNLRLNFQDEYVLDSEGNMIQAKYNIWSRLLNKNRIRI